MASDGSILWNARLLDPEYGRTDEFLSFAYREKGMYAEAIEVLRSRFALSVKNRDVTEEQYLEVTQALDQMQNSLERGSEGFWQGTRWDDANDPYFTAVAFAKLGDKGKAFEYLERAFNTRYTGMVWLKVTPDLDNLRPDPRFDDLLKRVGLR